MFKKSIAVVVLSILATGAWAQAAPRTIEMTVDGLVCAFCAQGIEKKLRKSDATADVLVSLEHRLVAVALKDGQDITDAALSEILTDAGYTLREIKRSSETLDAIRQRLPQS